MITRFSKLLSRAALIFSAFGLIGMTLIICWQVFARYVLNASPAWSEQAALFLMLWFIFFAAAVGVREGFHIRLTLLQDAVSESSRSRLLVFCHVIVLAFGALMAWNGSQLAIETWSHNIPTLNLPRGLSYIPIAGAGAIISFFSAEHIAALWRGQTVEKLWS
jgi:TRAP-type C4-dicarboxylate transport system permease small subunit